MTTTASVAEIVTTFEESMRQAVAEVDSANCLARKQSVHIYRAGGHLTEARNSLPPGRTWGKVLESFGIPRTTAWEAMKLYELAESEDAVSRLTITEAKEQYGITKPRKVEDTESDVSATVRFPSIASEGRLEQPSGANLSDNDAEDDEEFTELSDNGTQGDVDDSDAETDADVTPAGPPESPFDTLAKITKRLEYLEADLPSANLTDDSRKEVVEAIERLAQLLDRIRQVVEE